MFFKHKRQIAIVATIALSAGLILPASAAPPSNDDLADADPISEGAAKAMLIEIRKVTDKPIRYLLYSHEHADYASGGQMLRDAGATLVSHEACVNT